MPSAPDADRAWKSMTKSIPLRPGSSAAPKEAGTAAYTTLLRGPRDADTAPTKVEQWLLLRDRTAARPGGR